MGPTHVHPSDDKKRECGYSARKNMIKHMKLGCLVLNFLPLSTGENNSTCLVDYYEN